MGVSVLLALQHILAAFAGITRAGLGSKELRVKEPPHLLRCGGSSMLSALGLTG